MGYRLRFSLLRHPYEDGPFVSYICLNIFSPSALITAPVRNWRASKVHHHAVWAWHQSTIGWVWWESDLWAAQSVGRCVYRFEWLSRFIIRVPFNVEPHQRFCSPRPGGNYKGHVDVLAPTVQELATLEREAQTSFLHLGYLPNQLFRAFWAYLSWHDSTTSSCSRNEMLTLTNKTFGFSFVLWKCWIRKGGVLF